VAPPAYLLELDIRHRLGAAVLPAIALTLVLPLASAGAATTKPITKSVSDPAGDVVYTPIDGFTPTGPPDWADLLNVTYTVSKGDNLKVTTQVADMPEAGVVGTGWGVVGTVTLPDGRQKPLNAGVGSADNAVSAYVGSKQCGDAGSFSPATNIVVLKIDFSPCVDGRAVVRLYAKGSVSGAKTAGEDTYYEPVYVDTTATKKFRLR